MSLAICIRIPRPTISRLLLYTIVLVSQFDFRSQDSSQRFTTLALSTRTTRSETNILRLLLLSPLPTIIYSNHPSAIAPVNADDHRLSYPVTSTCNPAVQSRHIPTLSPDLATAGGAREALTCPPEQIFDPPLKFLKVRYCNTISKSPLAFHQVILFPRSTTKTSTRLLLTYKIFHLPTSAVLWPHLPVASSEHPTLGFSHFQRGTISDLRAGEISEEPFAAPLGICLEVQYLDRSSLCAPRL